jgi:adenylate cyclase, class 2
MIRYVFAHPTNSKAYIRVRQEGDKVTTSYKEDDAKQWISSVREIELTIDNAEAMRQLYLALGLREKAFQETYRETWAHSDVIITIDRWPGLKPFIEVEWPNQESVMSTVHALGLTVEDGLFGTVSDIYHKELWIPHKVINETAIITFDAPPKPWSNKLL